MMRIAVAGEKSLQPNNAGRMRRPDQHRSAGAALDQIDAAQDQRAHDALAEISFGDQKRTQSLRRNQQRFDVAFGVAIDQRDAAGELTDLGEKLPRPLVDHGRDVAEAIALRDCDMARQNDKHARPGFAGLEQSFAMPVIARLAEPAHPRDFLRRQRRKGLLITREYAPCRRALICLIARRGPCRHFAAASPKENQTTGEIPRQANRLFARAFFAAVTGGDVFGIGGCVREIVASSRLRFSPLEVFAQCQFQAVLTQILRGPSGSPRALFVAILHRRPARMLRYYETLSAENPTGWAKFGH